jgi:hypothetical protein
MVMEKSDRERAKRLDTGVTANGLLHDHFTLAVGLVHRCTDWVNLNETEQDFLRDLVKTSRQRPHPVRWTDRDGSDRVTMLSPADATRLNALARQHGIGAAALLQQGAHLPVKKADRRG